MTNKPNKPNKPKRNPNERARIAVARLNVPPGFKPDMDTLQRVLDAVPDEISRGNIIVIIHAILFAYCANDPEARIRIVMNALSMFDDMDITCAEAPEGMDADDVRRAVDEAAEKRAQEDDLQPRGFKPVKPTRH